MSDSKAADGVVQSVEQDEGTQEARPPSTRRKLYVSDKTKSGCRVKVDREVHIIRDQKLLRMRSTLGGLLMMQKTALQQSPRRCILPMHTPPNVGSRQKDRPLSSYLSGGSSARVPLLPHLLEPLPQLTGKEVFKSRHKGSMTERREGGGVLYHNMPRAFFPLAIGLGLRPKSPLVGVGGDIGKILDDSPNEKILPGRKWSMQKAVRVIRPHEEQPQLVSVGPPSLVFAFELENGSDEKDWWRFPGDLLCVSLATIQMLPQHFIFNGSWERAVVTLCNLHFIVEKMLLFGYQHVMKDLNQACAGLDVECKKFPDLRSWQDIYGTWRSQCYEYRNYISANAVAITNDVSVVFTAAMDEDWGTCSQDARFALGQARASVEQVKTMVDTKDGADFSIQHLVDVARMGDHIRIACKHGLHKCDESGHEWLGHAEAALRKTTTSAWRCKPGGDQANDSHRDDVSRMLTNHVYALLTKFLRNGMKITEQLATATITGRSEPRWYCTHINDSYVVNDLTRLLTAIDVIRERDGAPCFDKGTQLPVRQVGLYLSTIGSMTVERKLLTSLILPATAKYLARFGVQLSWTDLRSAGPEREFTKNCIVDACRSMDSCRMGDGKLFAMFLTGEPNMLSEATVYKRERMVTKRFAASKQTELDKATAFMAKLQTHFRARFDSIFEAWTYFDINGDWNVTTAEFVLQYKNLKMPISAREVLKVLDKDGYGEIDVHEFIWTLAWHELPGGGPNGTQEAIDKTVQHYALRKKNVMQAIMAKLAEFHEVHNDDDALLEALQSKAVPGEAVSVRKNLVTSVSSRMSRASQKSTSSHMSEEIVQDSVLGPEILQEASAQQGLHWLANPEFINCRLQRLELEHALVRNADRCEAIVLQRIVSPATRACTSENEGDTDMTCEAPLKFLGVETLAKMEQEQKFKKYSLHGTGPDMGAFALQIAFSVIDAIAKSNSTASTAVHKNITHPPTENQAGMPEAARASADHQLWRQESVIQISTLLSLQQRVLLAESKLSDVTEIWREGTGDDCSIVEAELGAFTRQECITQLAAWAIGTDGDGHAESSDDTLLGPNDNRNGGLELAIMRGVPGCGLSSVCAMLVRALDEARSTAAESTETAQRAGSGASLIYYFKRSELNSMDPETYLLSEMKGRLLQSESFHGESQVGLHELAGVLLQEARAIGKHFVVVIDGLELSEVVRLVSGCGSTRQQVSDGGKGGLKLIISLSDAHANDAQDKPLPRVLRDALSRVNASILRFVRVFQGLSERERCATLHSQLGAHAKLLSAERALAVCRLQDAALPEFLCVAAVFLKELSWLVPMDEAALAVERTLEDLFEFNIIAWLELIHGPQLVQSAAEVILQSRVYALSRSHLRALLPARSYPRLVDAETVENLLARLRTYCNISPQASELDGLILKSCTFRKVLAKKYHLTHYLDQHERLAPRDQNGIGRAAKLVSNSTRSSQTLKSTGSDSHQTGRTHTKSEPSGTSSEGGLVQNCDMDAVRSAMEALIVQRLDQQTKTRKESKPVPPTPQVVPPAKTPQPVETEDIGEQARESPVVMQSPSSKSNSPDPDLLASSLTRQRPGLTNAPVAYAGEYCAVHAAETLSVRMKMKLEPTLEALQVPIAVDRVDQQQHENAQLDAALLQVQRKATQQVATEERVSSLTQGVCLDKHHMWERLQASKLLPVLDSQILAAETVDEENPIPDMMLVKHRTQIAQMKETRNNLIKLWAGAKMDILWRAVSVRHLDVSCQMEAVAPGVYTAIWHLRLDASISDFPDIYCTLCAEDPAASAGPPVEAVLTVRQQDAVKTARWAFVVVAKFFYIGEACNVVASMYCRQGNWLSGLVIDAFALVPVLKDEMPSVALEL